MKRFAILFLLAVAGIVRAQTNAPAPAAAGPDIDITSEHGFFDGVKRQMIYQGHVLVTDARSTLRCGLLTVDLPEGGGRPTNIVALTNVVIDALDEKGQTNHITAEKAVYTYHVMNAVTNEVITFTGGDPTPRVENPQFTITGEPLVLDLRTRQFSGSNYRTVIKGLPGAGGTNASPFNLLK
jgi:hypothetical protein